MSGEDAAAGVFRTVATSFAPGDGGAVFFHTSFPTESVEVEYLLPFSWDAEARGVKAERVLLGQGERLTLHTGGYGTADAVAALEGRPFNFPRERDGHRYVVDREPVTGDRHQDAAGWVVVGAGDTTHVWAWEHSGAVNAELGLVDGDFHLTMRCPGVDGDGRNGPEVHLCEVSGTLDEGVAALKAFITGIVDEPDLSGMPGGGTFPSLVLNSWGLEENTNETHVLEMMRAAQRMGTEVFVLDKGWEEHVGDWHANAKYPNGLRHLSRTARSLGMGFGVWCGFGNADPASAVAQAQPDWLATWEGTAHRLSFDSLGLCLGHAPVEQWISAELHRIVGDFELTWLIHDFETVSRCNSSRHTHRPTEGEHDAALAWSRILTGLKRDFPHLVLENCWNGVRPLDLAMVRAHHTTIAEDHCTTKWNLIAKREMGRYLPLDWQSAYMGKEALPARARFAPYVVGGPWVVMEDPTTWDSDTWHWAETAAERYRAWRADWRRGEVLPSPAGTDPDRCLHVRGSSGTSYCVVQTEAGTATLSLDFRAPVDVIDGWTLKPLATATQRLTLPVDPRGDGVLLIVEKASR